MMGKRVDQEIDEILGKFEEMEESNHLNKSGNPNLVQKLIRHLRDRFSPRNLMIVGAALLFTALILNMFENIPVGPLLVLGIISFIGGYALFISRTGAKYELRWRGQSVNYKQTRPRKRKFL